MATPARMANVLDPQVKTRSLEKSLLPLVTQVGRPFLYSLVSLYFFALQVLSLYFIWYVYVSPPRVLASLTSYLSLSLLPAS